MDYYQLFWVTHVSMVTVSGCLFLLRGYWMLTESIWLQHKAIKVAPHVIDSLLLASAISLLFVLNYNPISQAWIAAKIIALLFYIVVGSIALKRGRSKEVRSFSLVIAVLIFFYIIAVAITRSIVLNLF